MFVFFVFVFCFSFSHRCDLQNSTSSNEVQDENDLKQREIFSLVVQECFAAFYVIPRVRHA